MIARDADALAVVSREVEARGGQALMLPTDITDPGQVEAAAAAVEDKFGSIDIWINNGVTLAFSPLKEMKLEQFRYVTEVIYLGTVYGTMAALHRMLPRNRGTIIQVDSPPPDLAMPPNAAYYGAKYAIQGFTESLRSELLEDNSRIRLRIVELPAISMTDFEWVASGLLDEGESEEHPEVVKVIVWAACYS